MRRLTHFGIAIVSAMLLSPATAWGCAACFGKSDSSLAQGMNMGILSLLVVIGTVLATFAGFFIFLARKSAQAAQPPAEEPIEAPEVSEPLTHS